MDSRTPRLTRAAVWTGDDVTVHRVAMPTPAAGDTVVRVRLATVCGSDLHTVAGRRPAPCPTVLGHEAVGEVVVAGARSGVTVGQRVVWSVTVSCGRCGRCRAGRRAKCVSVRKVGHEHFHGDWPLSGAYAEHIVLPAGSTIVRVPDEVPDAVAAPAACATATVLATLDAAGPLAGRRVLIHGAGMLGITATAACAMSGATVQTVDLDPDRVRLARRFGSTELSGPVDVAIDFSGSTAALGEAFSRLDVGGVLVLAGSVLPTPALAVDPELIVRRWLTLTGVHNYEPHHLREAVEFLRHSRDRFDWHALVADPVGLDAIGSALTPAPSGRLRLSVAP
ncbi:zinc-binding dehydrogenase [Mycolicibacterium thermoresistibile]